MRMSIRAAPVPKLASTSGAYTPARRPPKMPRTAAVAEHEVGAQGVARLRAEHQQVPGCDAVLGQRGAHGRVAGQNGAGLACRATQAAA